MWAYWWISGEFYKYKCRNWCKLGQWIRDFTDLIVHPQCTLQDWGVGTTTSLWFSCYLCCWRSFTLLTCECIPVSRRWWPYRIHLGVLVYSSGVFTSNPDRYYRHWRRWRFRFWMWLYYQYNSNRPITHYGRMWFG